MAGYVGKIIESPLGALQLLANGNALTAVLWSHGSSERAYLEAPTQERDHPVLDEAGRQLQEYFAGRHQRFSLRLQPAGTEFQQRVWAALLTIPYGETRSYGEIARQIGSPAAVRAVGAASGRNPLSIIVPCHRVIGSDGTLTGFAGGLETKARLLALEQQGCAALRADSAEDSPTGRLSGVAAVSATTAWPGAAQMRLPLQ